MPLDKIGPGARVGAATDITAKYSVAVFFEEVALEDVVASIAFVLAGAIEPSAVVPPVAERLLAEVAELLGRLTLPSDCSVNPSHLIDSDVSILAQGD